MRIAWMTPVSETVCLKSSEFTKGVLGHAPEDWEIELFCDSEDLDELACLDEERDETGMVYSGYPVFHYLRYFLRDKQNPFDIIVYQLEDHIRCSFVEQTMAIFPGITFLHDVNLNRLLLGRFAHHTSPDIINQYMDKNFGESSPRIGDWHVRKWPTDVFDRSYPGGKRSIAECQVVVTQNTEAKTVLEGWNIQAPIEITAMPVPIEKESHKEELCSRMRMSLRLWSHQPVVGFYGTNVHRDQAGLTLEALGRVQREFEKNPLKKPWGSGNIHILWIVRQEEEEAQAQKMLKEFYGDSPSKQSRVTIVQAASVEAVRTLLSVLDVFVCPRFDAMRSSPVVLLEALTRGIPTVTSDFGPTGEIPTPAVLKVPVGKEAAEVLFRVVVELLRDGKLRQIVQASAREYMCQTCSYERVISDCKTLFQKYGGQLSGELEKTRKEIQHNETLLLGGMRERFEELASSSFLSEIEPVRRVTEKAIADFSWGR